MQADWEYDLPFSDLSLEGNSIWITFKDTGERKQITIEELESFIPEFAKTRY